MLGNLSLPNSQLRLVAAAVAAVVAAASAAELGEEKAQGTFNNL